MKLLCFLEIKTCLTEGSKAWISTRLKSTFSHIFTSFKMMSMTLMTKQLWKLNWTWLRTRTNKQQSSKNDSSNSKSNWKPNSRIVLNLSGKLSCLLIQITTELSLWRTFWNTLVMKQIWITMISKSWLLTRTARSREDLDIWISLGGWAMPFTCQRVSTLDTILSKIHNWTLLSKKSVLLRMRISKRLSMLLCRVISKLKF